MLHNFSGGWMRFRKNTTIMWAILCTGVAFCAQPSAGQATLAIRGGKVYPISGPPIEHGVLVVSNGKIVAVGEEGKIKIPHGATVEDATGKIVMPGIVDSHSHIGIIANPMAEDSGDANESRWMPLILPTRTSAWRPPGE
jgi:cytosine/adenosine deaminase-related metal-dependent hydrolase